MTPQEVLMEFETSRTAPVGAIRAALDAREEMLPVFITELERAQHTPWQDLPHADSYSIIFYILGEWGDPRAYLPIFITVAAMKAFAALSAPLIARLGPPVMGRIDPLTETSPETMSPVP